MMKNLSGSGKTATVHPGTTDNNVSQLLNYAKMAMPFNPELARMGIAEALRLMPNHNEAKRLMQELNELPFNP